MTHPPFSGRLRERAAGGRHKRRTRSAFCLLIVSAAALAAAAPALADPSGVAAKQAEVQSVLNQIQQLDGSLERAIEAYNLATDRLQQIEGDLQTNTRELHIAKANLHRSQRALANRLVTLYTTGDEQSSALSILLGAGSIDEMLNQLETVVQERADQKASIQSQLSERHQLVASIRSEIERMKAEEAARQRELARQAAAARAAQAAQARDLALANPYSASSEPTISAPPSANGSAVVAIAMRYLGISYVWGGASPSEGFDCSGLIVYVFAQVGVSLPHHAATMYSYGSPVSPDQLQPGDLVYFDGLGHMGMYVGGGNFIHAPHTGDVVKISSMSDSWYASTYVGARRI